MKSIKISGLILIAIASSIPLIWFIPLAASYSSVAIGSQYIGSLGLILMAISQIIATRTSFIEKIFGPMDRAYIVHKWIGITSLAAVLLHDTIDADIDGLGRETLLVGVGDTLGEISLYGLLALVLLSVATFTPYRFWKWTHRFLGLFYICGALHYLLILKPFANNDPLGIYIGFFCVAGISAYAFSFLGNVNRRGKRYRISSSESTGHCVSLWLKPVDRPLRTTPGQFAFLALDLPELGESHPFTLSRIEADGALRVTIKALGDYTRRVSTIAKVGTEVNVLGPYGAFTRPSGGNPDIWVAAGVGITPFLAWANAMTPKDPEAHVFYSARGLENAPHLDELTALSKTLPLTLHVYDTQRNGRVTGELIAAIVGDVSKATVSFCGPAAMRNTLRDDLVSQGLNRNGFRYEEFEIRSGVGFRRLLRHVLRRINVTFEESDNRRT